MGPIVEIVSVKGRSQIGFVVAGPSRFADQQDLAGSVIAVALKPLVVMIRPFMW